MFRTLLKKLYLQIRTILLFPLRLLKKNRTLQKADVKRILLLRHDRVGDMVLSTPVFRALKKSYPDATITVLASERNHEILQCNPHVDEVLIYRGLRDFVRDVRGKRFDIAVDLFLTDEIKQAFMTYISGAVYRLGFKNSGREIFFNLSCPHSRPLKQMVAHLSDLAEAAGAEMADSAPEIFLSEQEREWARSELEREELRNSLIIAMHPGAHYPSQRWPVERFGESARQIIEYHRAEVFVFGSENERHLLEKIKNITGGRAHIFCGVTLRQFISLLNYCAILVCNNSGPMHIASSFRIPTVSMTGPTVVPLWLPQGKHHQVLNKKLFCSPCNKAVCRGHNCMHVITVDEVMDAVVRQIKRIKTEQNRLTAALNKLKEEERDAGENKQLLTCHE